MIDGVSLLRFTMQLGLALTGAGSVWVAVFYYLGKRSSEQTRAENCYKLASTLFPLFIIGLVLFVGSWVALKNIFYITPLFAHEGIIVEPAADYIQDGILATYPFVFSIALLGLLLVYLRRAKENLFNKYGTFLFGVTFLLVSVIAYLIVFTGGFSKLQLFYFLHHWHSIFTLGTVFTVDYLFLRTVRSQSLKSVAYPFFPVLSMVIWIGLGLDFLGNLLVFQDVFLVNNQLLFIQTVIAVIIINGTLLSQRINDKLIKNIKSENTLRLGQKTKLEFGLAGSVSIVSWLTISFVDFFNLDFMYWHFLVFYIAAVAVAFMVYLIISNQQKVFSVTQIKTPH